MLFNSTVFLQFYAGFLLLYFLCRPSRVARNALIVAASYLFYGWWDYRFLGLLIFSSLFDYGAGRLLERLSDSRPRKAVLWASLLVNLSLLGFFKYYGFFAESLTALFSHLHLRLPALTLGIVLPVGISFYTFQSMSYVIDVYRRQAKATDNLLDYLAYVAFFPQLVAGPIQRRHQLLPQLERMLVISHEMVTEGFWLLLWGMFKKVVLADHAAPLVDMVYENPSLSAPAVILGTVAFALQIYGDFSGYSDIARGTARLLGIDIPFNFQLPYWATDPRDFWRRWHISLSSWLRDYLYISLGGNRRRKGRTYLNLWLTLCLGGLWHGAAWHYVLWGAWHGLGLMGNRWWRDYAGEKARLPAGVARLMTFLFVLYGWLLFRASSWDRIQQMTVALTHWTAPVWLTHYAINLVLLTVPLATVEIWQWKNQNLLAPLAAPRWLLYLIQGLLFLGILLFWETQSTPFIYFQF
jgi:alginate O-acetyltransferase complex protein AlgI